MLGPNISADITIFKDETTDISDLPFDLLLIIINYVDAKSKQALLWLKPFSMAARVSLYRFPIISNTFAYAQFIIACRNNQDLAKNVLGVDLGASLQGKARLPCVHLVSDAYGRKLYLQPPVALFPFSGLLHTNILKPELPSLTIGDHSSCVAGSRNLLMKNELIEIWTQMSSLASSFPILGLDHSLNMLLDKLNPKSSPDSITNVEKWSKVMQIFDRYEMYFCSIEMAFHSAHPDPMPWRNFTHLLQIPPHQIEQWFERELIWVRETNGTVDAPIYKTFKSLCALVNKFYHLTVTFCLIQACECQRSDRKGYLCIFTSSLVQLSISTPFLQSLSLSGRRLEDDEQIKETGEYRSQIGYDIPEYYTRTPVTATDALHSVLVNCKYLKHLDLSSCKWVTEENLLMILKLSDNLLCLNLLGCSQFPSLVAKLWFFDNHADFVSAFSAIAFPKKVSL